MKRYYYHIDMDERGEFHSHLEDRNNKVVWDSGETQDMIDNIESGFMKHARDVDGLELWLKSLDIIPDDSIIYLDE